MDFINLMDSKNVSWTWQRLALRFSMMINNSGLYLGKQCLRSMMEAQAAICFQIHIHMWNIFVHVFPLALVVVQVVNFIWLVALLDQLDAISRIVQLRSSQSVAMEGLPGSEAAFEEISPQSMGTTSPIVGKPTPRAPPRLDTTNQAVEVPSVEREEPFVPGKEAHTMQMPKELLKALLDEATTPQPLTLQHCWLHLPPICPQYQRCVVCVDKLGLSLRPLGRSKYPADELHRISGLKILHTESLNFPLSSILNVEEVAGQITEQVMEKQPAETQTWRTHFGRKHFLPLARLVFSRSKAGQGQKQKPCPEAADQLPAAAAYFVNVKIRAGITGKIPGQDSRRNSRKSPIFCVGGGGGGNLVSLCLS